MALNNLIDTLLNIFVFAFIGFLVLTVAAQLWKSGANFLLVETMISSTSYMCLSFSMM